MVLAQRTQAPRAMNSLPKPSIYCPRDVQLGVCLQLVHRHFSVERCVRLVATLPLSTRSTSASVGIMPLALRVMFLFHVDTLVVGAATSLRSRLARAAAAAAAARAVRPRLPRRHRCSGRPGAKGGGLRWPCGLAHRLVTDMHRFASICRSGHVRRCAYVRVRVR